MGVCTVCLKPKRVHFFLMESSGPNRLDEMIEGDYCLEHLPNRLRQIAEFYENKIRELGLTADI